MQRAFRAVHCNYDMKLVHDFMPNYLNVNFGTIDGLVSREFCPGILGGTHFFEKNNMHQVEGEAYWVFTSSTQSFQPFVLYKSWRPVSA